MSGAGKSTSNIGSNTDFFIDEEHHDYKDCPLKALDTQFHGNQADIEAFFRLYALIVTDKLQDFTVQNAFKSSFELAQMVNERVRGVDTCNINFGKGTDGPNSAIMKFAIKKSKLYFMYPSFGYF